MTDPATPDRMPSVASVVLVYVDAEEGDDSHSGSTPELAVRSLSVGVQRCRAARAALKPSPGNVVSAGILLKGGQTHYVTEAVELLPEDSFLEVTSYPQGSAPATISGAQHFSGLKWTKGSSGSWSTSLNATKVPALRINGERATLARFPNANPETDLFPVGYFTGGTSWTAPQYRGQTCNPNTQCGTSVNYTRGAADGVWHGMYQNYTQGIGGACEVYDPPQSPWCSGDFYLERQFPEMHTRHPAGMTVPDGVPTPTPGAVVHAWRPGHWYSWMFEVDSMNGGTVQPGWTNVTGMNNIFGKVDGPGNDGPGIVYLGQKSDTAACEAACKAIKGCKTWTYHTHSFTDPAWVGGCYSADTWAPSPETGVNSGRAPYTSGSVLSFGAGGNQGGEGNDRAAEWWMDGSESFLDAPNEYFFDSETQTLTFNYNATGTPPSSLDVPTASVLLHIRGSQAYPVVNVTVRNLVFRDTRPTYMDPRGNPSGGDWALERQGAVLLEGGEGIVLDRNVFTKLDSNAVFLSGYNRGVVVSRNDFSWLGQSAIASWGITDGMDGTDGNQPRGTLIKENWIHEIGHIQKQSSFYFQAETALVTLEHNICFNIPRAAINFNDGFGGGNVITENLLFNTCRESSDHGAFNSWDRLPYLTLIGDGTTPSTRPAWNDVHHNFIVANYAADGGCLDNDDGSSYYNIHHNLCVFGGHKSDFDGNNKISHHNLHIYPSVYGTTCLNIAAQLLPPKGYAEGYHDNTCVLPKANSKYLHIGGIVGSENCFDTAAARATFQDGLITGNNSVYVPEGAAYISCGGRKNKLDIKDYLSRGLDTGTKVMSTLPSASTMAGWAEDLLMMQK